MVEIPLLDNVLKIFPWHNSQEYKKLQELYGSGITDVLYELILLPMLRLDSINDLSQVVGNDKNQYYDLLKDPAIHWPLLLQEISFGLFISILRNYQAKPDRSYRSRWRIRILMDDTLLRRWSLKMAGVHNIYNHTDKFYMYAHKLVFLAISIGDGKLVFPLFFHLSLPGDHPQRLPEADQAMNILNALYIAIRREGLCLDGVRLVGDSAYTTKEMVQIARLFGLEYYGSLSGAWHLQLEDGTTISVAALKRGCIATHLRQNNRLPNGYYRLRAFHPDLGKVALCIIPYIEAGTHRLKYSVYVSSNPDLSCVTIRNEHTLRWKIEQMFKTFKYVLGIRFYHGLGNSGQYGWFALTCLRFLFAQLAIKLASRFPSLRWGLPAKKFGLISIIRYIRDHYYIDSKSIRMKRLHYSLIPKAS